MNTYSVRSYCNDEGNNKKKMKSSQKLFILFWVEIYRCPLDIVQGPELFSLFFVLSNFSSEFLAAIRLYWIYWK